MAVWRANVAKLSSNFGGHCSSSLLRSDSDVRLFNEALQESGHVLQKFSDDKKLSVSDKLLRFPTMFTSEEQKISRKKTYVAHTETAEQMETTDSTGGSLGERLKWLRSEIKLSITLRKKASLEPFYIMLPQRASYRNTYSFGYRHGDKS